MKLLDLIQKIQDQICNCDIDEREEQFAEGLISALENYSPNSILSLRQEYIEHHKYLTELSGLRICFKSLTDAIGDDSFDDFCSWVISMGSECYEECSNEKPKMEKYLPYFDEGYYLETFSEVFSSAYETKTGGDINDV